MSRDRTVLKIMVGKDGDMSVIQASHKVDHLVNGLRIDGNKVNQETGEMHGIDFREVNNSKIVDTWVEKMWYLGIVMECSSDNTISGNTIPENGWCGINLYRSSNSAISDNAIHGKRVHGIYLSDSSNNAIRANMIMGNSRQQTTSATASISLAAATTTTSRGTPSGWGWMSLSSGTEWRSPRPIVTATS